MLKVKAAIFRQTPSNFR